VHITRQAAQTQSVSERNEINNDTQHTTQSNAVHITRQAAQTQSVSERNES